MMKPKKIATSSSSSSSYIERRRLVRRQVKQVVFKAALKKKHLKVKPRNPSHHEVDQEGGLVPSSFGVFQDGEFVQLTWGFLVASGTGTVPYYLPVVDNHGFLLGQFSELDDLRIIKDESPNVDTSSTIPPPHWGNL